MCATEHTNAVYVYIQRDQILLTKSICLISVSVAFSEMFPTNTVVATLMSEADTLFYRITTELYLQNNTLLLHTYRNSIFRFWWYR